MDPLTALSLAVNVITIVDAAAELVHTTWEVSKTGAKIEHVEIEDQAKQIRGYLTRLNPGLNADTSSLSPDDKDLVLLCQQSEDVSKQLLNMLDRCRPKQSGGKVSIDTFWHAVKSQWYEDEVKDLQMRLERIDQKAHQLIAMRYSFRILQELNKLERLFQTMGTTRSSELAEIRHAISELSKKSSSDTSADDVSRELMLRAAQRGGLGKDLAVRAGILDQLRYKDMDLRLHELQQRPWHKKSYAWLGGSDGGGFAHSDDQRSNFASWLASGERLYWISGVPGSGKSTLMNFVYSTLQPEGELANWTQGRKLLKAAYFFWEVGKVDLLRTQEGLLRTLLFQVLRQCPDLIPVVYADLWVLFTDATPSTENSLSSYAGSQVSLDLHQLLDRMKTACQELTNRGYCLFLVIDGLDEYGGKPSEIIHLIQVLQDLPSIKSCVSSRPENEFLQSYGGATTKIFMEQFNMADITAYVRGTLESHPRFKDDDEKDTLGNELIQKVVANSNGVFLWVRLVVEELIEGLTNHDTLAKLQRRLDQLPTELGEYFNHILNRVTVLDREDSATMLQVNVEACRLLLPLTCWFISEGPQELDAKHEIEPTQARRNFKRRKDIETRLRNFSRGLLVIQDYSLPPELASLPSSSLFGQKVNFLHRTIRDYLVQDEVRRRLTDWQPNEFQVDEVICKAILANVRTSPDDGRYFVDGGPIADLLDIFNAHHQRMRGHSSQAAQVVRDDLAAVLSHQAKRNGHTLSLTDSSNSTSGAPQESNPNSADHPKSISNATADGHRSTMSRAAKIKMYFKRS